MQSGCTKLLIYSFSFYWIVVQGGSKQKLTKSHSFNNICCLTYAGLAWLRWHFEDRWSEPDKYVARVNLTTEPLFLKSIFFSATYMWFHKSTSLWYRWSEHDKYVARVSWTTVFEVYFFLSRIYVISPYCSP